MAGLGFGKKVESENDADRSKISVSSSGLSSDKDSVSSGEVSEKTSLIKDSKEKSYATLNGFDLNGLGYSDEEIEILRRQIEVPSVTPSFLRLFRYADKNDLVWYSIGLVASILEGLMKPLMAIVFGYASQDFTDFMPGTMLYNFENTTCGFYYSYYNSTYCYNPSDCMIDYQMAADRFVASVSRNSLYLFIIGIGIFVLTWIKSYIFIDRAEILAGRIRQRYLAAILSQNVGFFDNLGAGEITTCIGSDMSLIQDAMSEKVSYVISHFTTFVGCIVIAYTQSYILTSIMLGDVFLIISVTYGCAKFATYYAQKAQKGYSQGASIAEESLSSVRNVQAFSIQESMVSLYRRLLELSEKSGIIGGCIGGFEAGATMFLGYGVDATCFWQGTRLYSQGDMTVAQIMTSIMALFQGAFAFTIIAPYMSIISSGVAASSKVFASIDRESAIDCSEEYGEELGFIEGNIEFKNLRFSYPSRPNQMVFKNFNLKVPAGKTVALVGASGSGKSTIIGLLERFYNPLSGDILLDGRSIFGLNPRWLRQQLSLVSQEPSLFATSVYENICFGMIGSKYEFVSPAEKRELVIDACKRANAWDFIQKLPEGLETNVGDRGFLMSGGQKQRIAIARAIVSDPKILLLDEATSALDTTSESVVQEALDAASKNRTTIVIAHRLSTVVNSDIIVVMRRGEIIEQGSHSELLALRGEYYSLVKAQEITKNEEEIKSKLSSNKNFGKSDEGFQGADLDRIRTALSVKEDANEEELDLSKRYSNWSVIKFVMGLGKKELPFLTVATLCGVTTGLTYIGLGILYGVTLQAFQMYPYERFGEKLRDIVYPYAAFIFMIGCVILTAGTTGSSLFAYSFTKIASRVRVLSFSQFLYQDIKYFDEPRHSIGVLTSALSSDAQSIQGIGGSALSKILEALAVSTVGVAVSIGFAWKLGLVMFVSIPAFLTVGYFRFRYLEDYTKIMNESNLISSNYACEAVVAIRTLLTLTREKDVLEKYKETLARNVVTDRVASVKSAALDGLSRGMQNFIMALAFWYGGVLVSRNEYSLMSFFIVFVIVVFGTEFATTIFTFIPEMTKGLTAGRNIKYLLEGETEIDSHGNTGALVASHSEEVRGEITFDNVHFRYPTRMQVPVLQGLDLEIKPGQFVALVGASGCGKSTTIGLLESFYRPQKGRVLFDGKDIKSLNIKDYRRYIALVQQEPTLYAGSIRYNVALGSPTEVTDDMIIEVCKQANIHDFIMSLPDGYDTNCGSRGLMLSGGQKQRIAIARALIRQPKVLLLDEATSALDSESEKVVQAALDKASKGRTTIAIAHRLSTIQKADVIYVFENGKVVESGTHNELLALGGKYTDLVKLQSLEEK
ncbi:P-loop containing nucleoside triphosphate hydrolase protein [Dipodascopsis uninucleata]